MIQKLVSLNNQCQIGPKEEAWAFSGSPIACPYPHSTFNKDFYMCHYGLGIVN